MPRGRGGSKSKSPGHNRRQNVDCSSNVRSRSWVQPQQERYIAVEDGLRGTRVTRASSRDNAVFERVDLNEEDAVSLYPDESSQNFNSEDMEVNFEEGGVNINMQVSSGDQEEDQMEQAETEEGEVSDDQDNINAEEAIEHRYSNRASERNYSMEESEETQGDEDDPEVFFGCHGSNNNAAVHVRSRSRRPQSTHTRAAVEAL